MANWNQNKNKHNHKHTHEHEQKQKHKNSQRNKEPFVVMNGALLQSDNYEEELFGSDNSDGTTTYGFLERTKGGTLLIDEVSEIPLDTQAKILRVLMDQKFRRINGKEDGSKEGSEDTFEEQIHAQVESALKNNSTQQIVHKLSKLLLEEESKDNVAILSNVKSEPVSKDKNEGSY